MGMYSTPLRCALFVLTLTGLVTWICATNQKVNYQGHQVLTVHPRQKRDVEALERLQKKHVEMQFLTPVKSPNGRVHVMVPPKHQPLMKVLLKKKGIDFQVSVPDVQKLIDESQLEALTTKFSSRDFDLSQYHNYDQIMSWLATQESDSPGLVKLVHLGNSFEGRSIHVVKLSRASHVPKPAVWMDAGIHANEWVGPATMLYLIDQFVKGDDAEISTLLDKFDWYILPLFNVDGYIYTWEADRMWRKNRSVQPNVTCVGVDLNRNWGSHWGEGESALDPCNRNYVGSRPFSEPETKAVARFLQQHNDTIRAYLAIHSFSQVWMVPYSFTSEFSPPNLDELLSMCDTIVKATRAVNGVNYYYGRVSDVVGEAPGASIDYTSMLLNIPYSFGVELRDEGQYGTLLPANQIIPTAQETMAAIKTLARMLEVKLLH